MSACISREGEYSEHETTEGNFICDRCGVLDEDGLFAERDALRAKVVRAYRLAKDEQAAMDLWWTVTGDDWAVPDWLPSKFLRAILDAPKDRP